MIGARGWRPDPAKAPGEPPDWDAGALLGAHPVKASASARALVTSILDQGGLGSCTCNAAMQAVHASHVKQGAPASTPFGSRLFAYYFARAISGETKVDAGTYLRLVFEILNKFGFPPEAAWPYSDDSDPKTGRFTKVPSFTAVRAAYDQHAPTSYHKILDTGYARIDAIKRAIDAQHLVCFGTEVSEQFCNDMGANGGNAIDVPTGLAIAGGHALCVGEYVGDVFGIVNSWGEGYGEAGWCKFTADYLAWSESRDFWIVESAPRFQEAA